MALELLNSLPPIMAAISNKESGTVSRVWYDFLRNLADKARVSDSEGGLTISGSANEVQLKVIAFHGQNVNVIEFYDNTGSLAFFLDANGNVQISGTLNGRNIVLDGDKLDTVEPFANHYVHPDHSGDITSNGDGSTVINQNIVRNDQMQQMAESTIKGRSKGSGAGNVEDLTSAQGRAILFDGEAITLKSPPSGTDLALIQDGGDLSLKEVTLDEIVNKVPAHGQAKAWIKFNGTGTIAVNGSYNVASISDLGTGNYRITWSTPFADTNYAVIGTAKTVTGNAIVTVDVYNALYVEIKVYDQTTLADSSVICLSAFGNQ